ncbi:MAG: PEGA domain-containing protein [Ignavibacteriales bacterium]|nr:MAG: PEGA domain-containing protein [Ignavibacteriales bacterium]
MKRLFGLSIIMFLSLIFVSCEEEGPPVLPGLVKSTLSVATQPPNATIVINNRQSGKTSPGDLSELEPGFYRIDLKLNTYLDTTYYYLIKRGVRDTISVEMREDPAYWWQIFRKESHPIPTNSFNKVMIDSAGVKHLSATSFGLVIFDNASWTNYTRTNSPLPSNTINDMHKTGGVLWIATDAGLVRFDGSIWTVYNAANSGLPSNYITAVTSDKRGRIWFGSDNGGLVVFDGVVFRIYNTFNSAVPSDNVTALFSDTEGNIWAGTWGEGVYKFDGTTFETFNNYNKGLVSNFIRHITADKNGSIWIASGNFSGGGGLSRITNGFLTNFTQFNSGFRGSIVTGIQFDKYNNPWVTTADAGLMFREGSRWRQYIRENSGMPSASALSVAIDQDGSKWVVSDFLSKYIGYR